MVGDGWRCVRCLEVFGGSTQFILSSEVQDPPHRWRWLEVVGGCWCWLEVVYGDG